MGMFNMIRADLLCPVKKRAGKETEIQIKWQKYKARTLSIYHLGEQLEDLEAEFENRWIRTNYICEVCSKKTRGHRNMPYVRVDDQQWHYVFVKVERSKITEILSEEEFKKRGITNFKADL